ncbi:MAG: hypothetical protein JSR28_07975 [Proteobacteria bacterium]|nr:hypothetical protein [Pseudomonadota bacterium]MDE2411723.1 hypothetical protein [Sphingomonadales bacterium]
MTGIFKKSVFGAALAATALASATPAMADPYGGYRRHNGGDTAGAAILGGMVGLAIGVIAASAGHDKHRCDYNRNDDRYRDGYRNDRCYRDGRYQGNYPQQGGYYGNYPQQGGYYGDYRQYPQQGGYYDQRGGYDRRDGDRDGD